MLKQKCLEVIVIMGILASLSSLFGCTRKPAGEQDGVKGSVGLGEKAVDNESGVTGFSYYYAESPRGENYSYQVKTEDGQLVFLYENIEYRDRGEMKIPVTDQLLQDLTDLYKSLRLAEWDGFSRYNTLEQDGYSFTLSISFADGKDMSARGENVFPERYKEFKAKLKEIFGPLCEEAIGEE